MNQRIFVVVLRLRVTCPPRVYLVHSYLWAHTLGGLSTRIIQVCHRYYPYIGGVETHVREISERLAERFDVEVLTTDPSGGLAKEEIIGGVKVKRFKSWAPNNSCYFSGELKKYLTKNVETSDILHAHSYHDLPAFYCTRIRKVKKFVFTPHYHGGGRTFFRNLLHIPYKFFGRKIFEKADDIICVSNYEKSLILNHFKIDNEKVTVIPNGVNFEEFEGLEKRGKSLRVILYVGRLEKYKGVHHLIRALPKLDDDVILEAVGIGPYKRVLVQLARTLGVRDRVRFYQGLPRKELLQRYADADLFVLLSKHEAYGISVAEALASRTPCIVANTSALREWVNNKNCFGINYPINLDRFVKLTHQVIGKRVNGSSLPSWHNAVERLARIYAQCS